MTRLAGLVLLSLLALVGANEKVRSNLVNLVNFVNFVTFVKTVNL